MTDLTPTLNTLLLSRNAPSIPPPAPPTPSDEFLKEAHRINSHINSLITYLSSTRQAYLSTTKRTTEPLTDAQRDTIDASTALVLRDLASSIANLSDAESLRQKTSTQLLHKKYGHSGTGALLRRWAGGGEDEGKSEEQVDAEERERTLATVREGVLWFLRRGLEVVASVQKGMVEKRIERVREKEKSVLYKATKGGSSVSSSAVASRETELGKGPVADLKVAPDTAVLSESETREIEQLSAEQLQLFEEENDSMLKHYEDTLGKVQNAEKSLLEISSLQETLVTHLSTQEEYISQLVSDVDTTEENVGRGNRELKRATERKSPAQAVFWGTVGLCTSLVVWDLVF
ncbi:hypothetical protein N7532_000412 [Penicillium argentinense]|uniref:t-SNARE coiled-coil homology domain-containing protein n=1 Tax=Penicillium argentinense TaxID=1131581 RepID=A0A9W9KNU5_9EURO|nr:uncharacterized protein N7532_000412 [Penicillium argentinense]KAJ5112367.1 hypothetical protein N7532_000412 [Penicillium argentinense]